jgi:hypothetical protein
MSEEEYDVVTDVLTKHRDKLQEMTNANLKSEYIGWNIMDDIREKQIYQINQCLTMWKEWNRINLDDE